MQKKKAVFNWSGGKDSAHALWKIMQSDEYEILFLLTTVNQETTRSTMHGIPMELLQAQSRSTGIPLKIIGLRPRGDMDDYNRAMTEAVEELKAMGITHFIFGDIFLYDVMQYRKRQLEPMGIQVVEPLWGKNTVEVMDDFLQTRLKTVIVTTMHDGLGKKAIGKTLDAEFIASLPSGCDPNGENGEYHTFCYDGPIFSYPVPFRLGEPFMESYDIKLDTGEVRTYSYWFANLRPSQNEVRRLFCVCKKKSGKPKLRSVRTCPSP